MTEPEGPTPGVEAKAGQVLAWVLKVEVVDTEAPKGACVVLPKAGWSGAEVGAWAGAGEA